MGKIKDNNLILSLLKNERDNPVADCFYIRLQIDMTYNSNRIEGNQLSYSDVADAFLLRKNKSRVNGKIIGNDDIIETFNHFNCIDFAVDSAESKLSESIIKQFHFILKNGTRDSMQTWFRTGDYKLIENEIGGQKTTSPNNVKNEIQKLLNDYNSKSIITVKDIIDFHQKFETIHPFQDGNGRVGRLIMLKECLKHNIVPILIKDEYKQFYYRGLKEYNHEKGYLIDTCLNGQDVVKTYLDYYHISC